MAGIVTRTAGVESRRGVKAALGVEPWVNLSRRSRELACTQIKNPFRPLFPCATIDYKLWVGMKLARWWLL
jgi:hypothetical protein